MSTGARPVRLVLRCVSVRRPFACAFKPRHPLPPPPPGRSSGRIHTQPWSEIAIRRSSRRTVPGHSDKVGQMPVFGCPGSARVNISSLGPLSLSSRGNKLPNPLVLEWHWGHPSRLLSELKGYVEQEMSGKWFSRTHRLIRFRFARLLVA